MGRGFGGRWGEGGVGGGYSVVNVKAVHGTCMHSVPRGYPSRLLSLKTVGSWQREQ